MAGGPSRSLTVVSADTPKKSRSKKAGVKKMSVKKAKKTTVKKAIRKTAAKTTPKTKKATRSTSKQLTKQDVMGVQRQPLGHLLIEQLLREVGFRGVVSTDKELLTAYSTDESIFAIKPQVVLQPRNQKDVEMAVKVIAKETGRFPSLSLTPRAAGTGLSGGSLTDSIVVDVSKHLTTIEEPIEHSGMTTITCGPGAMLRDVEKKLKAVHHYLPASPASKDICAVGGCVSNNAAGADTLRYGHFAESVVSLDVVLHDGHTYTIRPLTYKEYKALIKKKNAHARIAKEVFTLIEKNYKEIEKAKPKTAKNSAGYALWDALDVTPAAFKKGRGHFDLTRLISGSQGTIGIITRMTLRAEPIVSNTHLIAVPIFNLAEASNVVVQALEYNPINVEIFDGLSFDLALKNPDFFKDRIKGSEYYRVLLSMYTTYHLKYRRKIPDFTLLITIDEASAAEYGLEEIVVRLQEAGGPRAKLVKNPTEQEMFWQIRRASYSLSKFQDKHKRPAAFLEDMTVPPEQLSAFFSEIKKLLAKYNVTAAVHGHGGNGHFHFYPLLDFRSDATALLVEKMSEEFFSAATKYGGNICGEHNDGIIRTPHLSKMFSKKALDLFKQLEHTFDPDDIFNPGKKVNPRFDIKETLRKTN